MSMVLSREIMLQPYYEIHLNNVKLTNELKKYITNVEVEESDTEACMGRVTVADVDFKFSNMTQLAEKLPIKIYMGHKKSHRLMLSGEVSYIEADFGEDGVPYITIGAIDMTSKMTAEKKSRTWANKKSSEVVKQIAKEYGLKANVQESLNIIEQITQEEESDAQLVARLAEDEGYVFFYSSDTSTIYWGERFEGLTATENLYYNSGDKSVKTFKPTLVQKNKAQLVEKEESSVSDTTGSTVSSGSYTDSSYQSSAGAEPYYSINTLTGQVNKINPLPAGYNALSMEARQEKFEEYNEKHNNAFGKKFIGTPPPRQVTATMNDISIAGMGINQATPEEMQQALDSAKGRSAGGRYRSTGGRSF